MSTTSLRSPPMTVRDAVRWIRDRTGKKPSVETIHRWMKKGVRGKILPALRLGGVWYVETEDLVAFIESGRNGRSAPLVPEVSHDPEPLPSRSRWADPAIAGKELKQRLGRLP